MSIRQDVFRSWRNSLTVVCLSALMVFASLTAPIRPRGSSESVQDSAAVIALGADHSCGCADLASCAGGCCCDPDWTPPEPEADSGPLLVPGCGQPAPSRTVATRILLFPPGLVEPLFVQRPRARAFEGPAMDPSQFELAPPTPPPRA